MVRIWVSLVVALSALFFAEVGSVQAADEESAPPLKRDSDKAREVSWYEGKPARPIPVEWTVKPDPAPLPTKPLTSQHIKLTKGTGQMVNFSGNQGAKAGYFYGDYKPTDRKANILEFIDLVTGKTISKINMRTYPHYQLFTDDGTRLALLDDPEYSVWSVPDGKKLVAWTDDRGTLRSINAWFTDNDHLLIQHDLSGNAKREIIYWKVPECEALWHIKDGGQHSIYATPGRKYFAAYFGTVFVEAATGEVKGILEPAPGSANYTSPPVFSRDGNLVAMQTTRHAATATGPAAGVLELTIWDLKTGKVQSNFPWPEGKLGRPRWVAPDYLLLKDEWLYSLQHKRVVWRYLFKSASATVLPDSPDDRIWCLWGYGGSGVLSALEVPDKNVQKLIADNIAKLPTYSGEDTPPVIGGTMLTPQGTSNQLGNPKVSPPMPLKTPTVTWERSN